jgi:hypothetical protein
MDEVAYPLPQVEERIMRSAGVIPGLALDEYPAIAETAR